MKPFFLMRGDGRPGEVVLCFLRRGVELLEFSSTRLNAFFDGGTLGRRRKD